MDFLNTFFSVVTTGGASQTVQILASDDAHGHHYPRPEPHADTIVLNWDKGGELDLTPLKEYGFAADHDDGAVAMRSVVKRWCLAMCPNKAGRDKWSWTIQMVDLVGLLLNKDSSFFLLL